MRKLIIIACLYTTVAQAQDSDSTIQKSKWTNMIQIGQLFEDNGGLTGRLVGTYTSGVLHNRLFAGVELGFSDYSIFSVGSIALYGKYRIIERGVSPYGFASFGYGRPLYSEGTLPLGKFTSIDGGIQYGAGAGIDIPMGKAIFLLQLGYKFQKITYDEPTYNYNYFSIVGNSTSYEGNKKYTIRKMHRVEFKIGVQF